jgi:hypothetical protein
VLPDQEGGNPVLVPETVMMQTPPPTIGAYASRLMQPSRLGIDLVIGIARSLRSEILIAFITSPPSPAAAGSNPKRWRRSVARVSLARGPR